MSREHRPPHVIGSTRSRALSAVLIAVGVALFASAVLTVRHLDPLGIVTLAVLVLATLGGGLTLAGRSGLFRGWSWSGRSWSELLTPGGPVRSPFEWIRVGIATSLGSILLFIVAVAVLTGLGWWNDPSLARSGLASDASVVQGILVAVAVLALLVGLVALLLGILAVVSLAVGVIGLGLRSGASSMSLRDWVSMDKRS